MAQVAAIATALGAPATFAAPLQARALQQTTNSTQKLPQTQHTGVSAPSMTAVNSSVDSLVTKHQSQRSTAPSQPQATSVTPIVQPIVVPQAAPCMYMPQMYQWGSFPWAAHYQYAYQQYIDQYKSFVQPMPMQYQFQLNGLSKPSNGANEPPCSDKSDQSGTSANKPAIVSSKPNIKQEKFCDSLGDGMLGLGSLNEENILNDYDLKDIEPFSNEQAALLNLMDVTTGDTTSLDDIGMDMCNLDLAENNLALCDNATSELAPPSISHATQTLCSVPSAPLHCSAISKDTPALSSQSSVPVSLDLPALSAHTCSVNTAPHDTPAVQSFHSSDPTVRIMPLHPHSESRSKPTLVQPGTRHTMPVVVADVADRYASIGTRSGRRTRPVTKYISDFETQIVSSDTSPSPPPDRDGTDDLRIGSPVPEMISSGRGGNTVVVYRPAKMSPDRYTKIKAPALKKVKRPMHVQAKYKSGGPCCNPSCRATTSPQWRRGPEYAPTLCNACGTRWARNGTFDLTSGAKSKKRTLLV